MSWWQNARFNLRWMRKQVSVLSGSGIMKLDLGDTKHFLRYEILMTGTEANELNYRQGRFSRYFYEPRLIIFLLRVNSFYHLRSLIYLRFWFKKFTVISNKMWTNYH